MKLIAGLGNGEAYRHTRHNLGAEVVELLAGKSSFRDEIEDLVGERVIFVPQEGFYNNSGEYISKKARFYKIDPSKDLLVICDDFYLDFGQMRLRMNGTSGGNNGLKSIAQNLGTEKFARLRLGVDDGTKSSTDADVFVLNRLSDIEIRSMTEIAMLVEIKIKEWLKLTKQM